MPFEGANCLYEIRDVVVFSERRESAGDSVTAGKTTKILNEPLLLDGRGATFPLEGVGAGMAPSDFRRKIAAQLEAPAPEGLEVSSTAYVVKLLQNASWFQSLVEVTNKSDAPISFIPGRISSVENEGEIPVHTKIVERYVVGPGRHRFSPSSMTLAPGQKSWLTASINVASDSAFTNAAVVKIGTFALSDSFDVEPSAVVGVRFDESTGLEVDQVRSLSGGFVFFDADGIPLGAFGSVSFNFPEYDPADPGLVYSIHLGHKPVLGRARSLAAFPGSTFLPD
jgi:hypothetical protein